MFNSEHRAERKAIRQERQQERNAAWAAANPEKAARWEAAKAQHQQHKSTKQELKEFVTSNHALRSFQNHVHVYPDRIIKVPLLLGEAEGRSIVGVSARVEEVGGISSRSTLTRSVVPGMHGWQKKSDDRKGYVVIDGPDFQWQIEYAPQFDLGGARKFVAAVNTAARAAAPAARPEVSTLAPVDPLEQLRKLAELCDAGIVTDEEFNTKKAQLLA
ncbi:MAG: SHOCT domain-containing protein [Actinomycetota bacterium]|nr:SHOCT domain-containing protein [Actinomycetota bacterium]